MMNDFRENIKAIDCKFWEEFCFQLSGEWKTIYMTSTNPEKLSETGPFRAFVHKFEFDVEHDTMTVNFFLK